VFILALFIRLFRSYLTVVRVVALASTCAGRGLRSAKIEWNGMVWYTENGKKENKAAPRGSSRLYTRSRGLHTYRCFFSFFRFPSAMQEPQDLRGDARGMAGIRGMRPGSRGDAVSREDSAALSSHAVQLSAPQPLGHYATRKIGSTSR